MKVLEKYDSYRLDHEDFREVVEASYEKGKIVDFYTQEGLPFLKDVCKVKLDSRVYENIPIFYHCKKGCYAEEIGRLLPDGSLRGGAKAFEVGDEAIVQLERGVPRRVVGRTGGPRMCVDIFKMDFLGWEGRRHFIHYVGDTQEEYCGLDQPCRDPYGEEIVCNEKGYILYGKSEFMLGTIMNYWGDFFVKVGPLMYIIRVQSIGLPGPMTGEVQVFCAVWTPELEEECQARGAAKEGTREFPEYPPELKLQPKLGRTIMRRFYGWKYPQPRWVFTVFWGQSW